MNEFVYWCRHLLVSFLFHALTSLHPTSFYRNDFSTCYYSTSLVSLSLFWFSSLPHFLLSLHVSPITLPLSLSLLSTKGSEWFQSKVNIEVSQASRKAIKKIETIGGKITTAHYNSLGLRVLLKPWKFEDRLEPRRALPNKKLMAYYLNPENRFVIYTSGKIISMK